MPGVLALDITGSANFGTFMPGVTKDYTASLAATATSSATAAELTVRDPSADRHRPPGQRLARAGAAGAGPRRRDAANPDAAFAPVPRDGRARAGAGVPGAVQRRIR